MVRGRVEVGIVVVIALIVVALIIDLAGVIVIRILGGVVVFIVGPVLRLEERSPIPISDVEAPLIAARKMVHAVDDVLWEGEGSENLTIQYSASPEAHEELCPWGVAGGL